jgi:SAM-dependent methyltransferase
MFTLDQVVPWGRSFDEYRRIYKWDAIQLRERITATYAAGKTQGRYVEAELPALPFSESSFDLALCSHFLFLYSSQLGEQFHDDALREMCRVGREIRIFPLLALGGARSPFVDRCAERLVDAGHDVSIERVPYEFQRGGNQMMRIRTCRRT